MDACRTRRVIQTAGMVVVSGLLLVATPARAADPLLMFVLGFAKNLIESAAQARKPAATPKPYAENVAPLPQAKPAATMDEADLRALVDESFTYLSRAQRAELLAGLDRALSDPANSAYREAILTQFVGVARQVQFTHGQLDRLSLEDKRAVAERFADNFRRLDPQQQQALLEQLRTRALPLPSDLNDMMLAALDRR